MSTSAMRVGDMSAGHSPCYPPYPVASGSPNVRVNSKAAAKTGSPYTVHCCGCCDPVICHSGSAVGQSIVRINGSVAHRVSNPVTCGDTAASGSPNVRYA